MIFSAAQEAGKRDGGLSITWYGQSMFVIEIPSGLRIVTDPYEPSLGKKPPVLKADVVTVSHDHYDHNNIATVENNPRVVREPGDFTFGDVVIIKGIQAFHDDVQGQKRGRDVIFKISAGGMSVAHMGDYGEAGVRPEVAEAIIGVDVLMLPVGGYYTIDGRQAQDIVERLKPRIAVPMHYKIPPVEEKIVGPEAFLEGLQRVVKKPSTISVDPKGLPEETEVWLMDYA